MQNELPIIDISDRLAEFSKVKEKASALNTGITAVGADYGHYINNPLSGDKEIYNLRDNLHYRIEASIFHLSLLLQLFDQMEEVIPKLMEEKGDSIDVTRYFNSSQLEINALFDSIIFHLSSMVDYLSLLVYYVSFPRSTEQKMWTQLVSAARDAMNPLSKKNIAKIIIKVDYEMIKKMNDYRADLIHRKANAFLSQFTIKIGTGTTNVFIFASRTILKKYKQKFDSGKDYTITYFIFWLLNELMNKVAEVIYGLKSELETTSYSKKSKNDNSSFKIVFIDQ